MSLPVRSLPLVQNWDCHACTDCCREYHVHVTEEERQRILAQGWEREPDLAGLPLFVREAWWSGGYRLYRRPDGRCVFLTDEGRCRIHARFGAQAKPLACRLYPFILVPAGDHWRVGVRFACPSAAQNLGRPLAEHRKDLNDLAAALETGPATQPVRPPALQKGQHVEWPDLMQFQETVLGILRRPGQRVERRLRKCLALAALCRQARFDKVTGPRLTEFLCLLQDSLDAEVPAEPAALAPPTWVGRVLFRQAVALLARKDMGPDRGVASKGRLALLRAGWRFARGTGAVPRVHARLPATTFDRLEAPAGPLPETAERALERYYTVKVESLQFCGPSNFGMAFWEGLESLALTLPAVLWLARAMADLGPEAAVMQAVRMVDHNFGYNRLLGSRRHRWGLSILARRGELDRLVAWYSR